MTQKVRFCTSFDGTRIAYATSGEGAPLVMSASWLTHLEHQWRSLAWKPWLEYLSSRHTLLRYDSRGCGLSDREVREISFEIWMRDFEAVVDAAGFDKFALLGTCQGGPIAIEYAARHPARVRRLVLYGSYSRGLARRSADQAGRGQVLLDMLGLGWGEDSHAYLQVWASLFQPGGTIEHLRSWSEQQRLSTSAETAALMFRTTFNVDVQDAARRVRCPTLVINPERDALVPLEEGRRLAGLIPDARFVALDTSNHMLLPEEPAWHRLLTEVEAFLHETAPKPQAASAPKERFSELSPRERDVLEAIARGLDNGEIAASLQLSEKTVRNHITRVLDKIGVAHRYQAIVLARDAGLGGASHRAR